ncbi:MAG: hypothetical protein IPK28_01475 [Devosia sp.]|nr:hypothetical protein [Devosia sp.]
MVRMSRALFIAARIVAIAGIGFLSVFALDVFGTGEPPLTVAMALFMHLLPNLLLVAMLAVAWRWPMVGGLLFLAASASIFIFLGNPFGVNLLLAGPLLLAGGLFIGGALSSQHRPQHPGQR